VSYLLQLLRNKANVNAINEHGNTPLHYACFWSYDLVAEVSTKALTVYTRLDYQFSLINISNRFMLTSSLVDQ